MWKETEQFRLAKKEWTILIDRLENDIVLRIKNNGLLCSRSMSWKRA